MKTQNPSDGLIVLPKKPIRQCMECFNGAKNQKLTRLKFANLGENDNHGNCCNIEKHCNKSEILKCSKNFHKQNYANIIDRSLNSFNAICRQQMLHKLDQLIVQKMITLQKINRIQSIKHNDATKNTAGKIERFCRQSTASLDQSQMSSIETRLLTASLSSNLLTCIER